MAESIAIVGPSGCGKTFSLRNLPSEKMFIFSPYKPLPSIPGSKKKFKKYDVNTQAGNLMLLSDMTVLGDWVLYIAENRKDIKYIVIEDFSHYMTNYLMSDNFRSKAGGKQSYSRFEQFAADAYSALFKHTPNLRDDLMLIYIFHDDHVETSVGGFRKFRVTAGKMLDEKVDLPSYFNYVLYGEVLTDKEKDIEERFIFRVVNDGYTPAKIPFGVYPKNVDYVLNDLAEVLSKIEDFNNRGE